MKTRGKLFAACTMALGLGLALALVIAMPAGATGGPPNDGHDPVTACHATPPDTAANGWNEITVDDDTILNDGHAAEHDADIIPAFTYEVWEQVGTESFIYEESSDFSDSRVDIDFESNPWWNDDQQVDISGENGWVVTAFSYDLEGDGTSWVLVGAGNRNNYNPPGSTDIDKVQVTVEKATFGWVLHTYPGKNLTTTFGWGATGQQVLDNDCVLPPPPPPASVNVTQEGPCTWDAQNGSLNPIHFTIDHANVTVTGPGGPYELTSSDTLNLGPGSYDYSWVAQQGYIGSGSGGIALGDCTPPSASVGVEFGSCRWDAQTGSLNEAFFTIDHANVTVTGPGGPYQLSGSATLNLPPGSYSYSWVAQQGYIGSGEGSFAVGECYETCGETIPGDVVYEPIVDVGNPVFGPWVDNGDGTFTRTGTQATSQHWTQAYVDSQDQGHVCRTAEGDDPGEREVEQTEDGSYVLTSSNFDCAKGWSEDKAFLDPDGVLVRSEHDSGVWTDPYVLEQATSVFGTVFDEPPECLVVLRHDYSVYLDNWCHDETGHTDYNYAVLVPSELETIVVYQQTGQWTDPYTLESADVPDVVITWPDGYTVTVPAHTIYEPTECLELQDASVSVEAGQCRWDGEVSSTAVAFTLSEGVTVLLSGPGGDQILTESTTLDLPPGGYSWSAVAEEGYQIVGPDEGGFQLASCEPGDASVLVDLGECRFEDNTSLTLVSFTLTGGITVTLTGPDEFLTEFSESGEFDLTPGHYAWTAVAAEGYEIEGPSEGEFDVAVCGPQCPMCQCPTCGAPIQETMGESMGIAWFSDLPCNAETCPLFAGQDHNPWVKLWTAIPSSYTQGGVTTPLTAVTTANGEACQVAFFRDGGDIGDFLLWGPDGYGDRFRNHVPASEYALHKYSACSIFPSWCDTRLGEDGLGYALWLPGHNVSDWAQFLLQNGFFPDEEHRGTASLEWAAALRENGREALLAWDGDLNGLPLFPLPPR